MKADSPLFDSIRIKPRGGKGKAKAEPPKPTVMECQWEGCCKKAEHRAPKGRNSEGEFYWFCLEHVQEYNKSYNYFSGMSDEDLQKFQKASMTGHRPTWQMGRSAGADKVRKAKGPKPTASGKPRRPWADEAADPFGLFGGADASSPQAARERQQQRTVGNAARKSFSTLGLDTDSDAAAIKARFKDLAKRLHPDLNQGDRASEDRLRDVIQAYNTLKASGFC
ncbi:MAG: DnaJ domain-containing protein [Devosiaceae bacterium]|nr:DnaJ domain-containing protein [Devosiaceae bacterium MH13]